MFIAIHCGGMPFNGESIQKGESLGGSESAAYFMAKELVNLGHSVTVFTNHRQGGKFDNVTYEWFGELSQRFPLGERFSFVMQAPFDVCIIQRHPTAFTQSVNSKLNIWWLHDIALYRQAKMVHHNLPYVDQVLTVSNWHKKQVSKVYDIPKEIITATTNGVDYSLLPEENIRGFEQREPRSLIFCARPERGLQELVAPNGLMEKLTDCKLYVCTYKNVPQHMQSFYDFLWKRCQDLPNVENVGFLGKRDLYDLIGRCQLYVYPTTFEDTSCIMILESNAAGTPFIGCDNAAQPETAKNGGAALLKLKDGKVDLGKFKSKIEQVLSDRENWQALHEKALTKQQSWGDAAKQWEKLFKKLLAERSSDKTRLYKHMERMSDIVPIYHNESEVAEDIEKELPDFSKNYHFLLSGEYEKHYDAYYQYEYNRGVRYGPEDLTGNQRFEQTAAVIAELKPKSILDYGCAHGHYIMNLKKRFHAEDIQYFGIDINQRNIDIAKDWQKKEGWLHEELYFWRGEVKQIEAFQDSPFDLILIGEVLEHVPEPIKLVEQLKNHLAEDGHILVTVPYGPWEAIGYEDHPGWRAHIHHFERANIWEAFGHQKNFQLRAIPHSGALGHYLFSFQNSNKPLGEIDYSRKLRQQAPRETVSVCMIARDSELTLGKAIQSIQSVADEIIVGIDEKTVDKTREVAESFGAKCFEIQSPLESGFDRARNKTIEKAKMDWIIWFDSDEVWQQTENLFKYLRSNGFDGYGIKQHHFAVEPPGILKTDFPCRMFRNHRGIKFYGHVHEHPEKEINSGVGKVYIIPDVSIMHTGFATESIRRKRFERNYPLMVKDHERYPDRTLGIFLWLRDLAHACRYTLERNNMTVTDQVMQWAEEAIKTWRKLLKTKHSRMVVEALPFYSECVQIARDGNGIQFAFNFAHSRHESLPQMSTEPMKGLFACKADIEALTKHLVSESTKIYEEKYY